MPSQPCHGLRRDRTGQLACLRSNSHACPAQFPVQHCNESRRRVRAECSRALAGSLAVGVGAGRGADGDRAAPLPERDGGTKRVGGWPWLRLLPAPSQVGQAGAPAGPDRGVPWGHNPEASSSRCCVSTAHCASDRLRPLEPGSCWPSFCGERTARGSRASWARPSRCMGRGRCCTAAIGSSTLVTCYPAVSAWDRPHTS